MIDDGFPILARSIGPSHGFVHVREIGTEVSVMGITVQQDELIHTDRHGANVIPKDVVRRLEQAIQTVIASEDIVLGPVWQPGFDIQTLECVWADFEKAHT